MPAHPTDDDLDKVLQGRRQCPRLESRLRRIAQQTIAVICGLRNPGRDGGDAFARRGGREVAPAFAFGRQIFMEFFEDLVLKAAAFAGVQLEQFSFLRAQAAADEVTERARGKSSSRLTEERNVRP